MTYPEAMVICTSLFVITVVALTFLELSNRN
ncbi:hypothetical protein UFOVP1444_5 [uncultured Caudovirales phage]|uniref:Holin-like toxin n=1 Tax=uncultured Caudovirales phage TaxID=2100421 RepID=A0A6J5SEQ1_9CAUD|nr:hypothetical protein UFOVP1444_5 [uncultured Caudovirales phage]CAB5228065.1 hypothetical protein UFOVP1536_50 [uncultured Caudovirales phage]